MEDLLQPRKEPLRIIKMYIQLITDNNVFPSPIQISSKAFADGSKAKCFVSISFLKQKSLICLNMTPKASKTFFGSSLRSLTISSQSHTKEIQLSARTCPKGI